MSSTKGCQIPRIGILLSFLSSVFYALSQGFSNLLTDVVTPEMLLVVRYLLHAVPLLPFIVWKPSRLVMESNWSYLLLISGGFFKGLESLSTYYSYKYIPLLDSMVLCNSQPVFVALISFVWLKEPVGFHEILVLIITAVGVVLTCEPPFIFGSTDTIDGNDRLIGSGIALAAAIFMSLCTCISRKLFEIELYLIIFWQGLVSVLIGFVLGIVTDTLVAPTGAISITFMFLVGFSGMISRVLITQGLKTEDATVISILQSTRLPLLFAFQWAIIGEQPSMLATIGAVLVTFASVLLTFKKWTRRVITKPMKRCCLRIGCCQRCLSSNEEQEELLGDQQRYQDELEKRKESFYASLESV
ncbi:Uncharacterised protein g5804 [Pycnogonum litorale]